MKLLYIALIVIACILALVGIILGVAFGTSGTASVVTITTTTEGGGAGGCSGGTSVCGTICCSSSLNLGKGCICTDSCTNVGTFNGDVFCCKDPLFPNIVQDQCCNSGTPASCQAGTPLTVQ